MESKVAATPASPMSVLGAGSLAAYWRFHEAVAKAQLIAWLPGRPRLLIDVSGPTGKGALLAAARGHTVVRVIPVYPGISASDPAAWASEGHAALGLGRWPSADGPMPPAAGLGPGRGGHTGGGQRGGAAGPGRAAFRPWAGWDTSRSRPTARTGRILPVLAEEGSLAFLADGCADGVIAEEGALSRHLMTEDLAAEIVRVLRPGGQLIACVDSLVLGMAMLAEQHHWAHLIDLPHSEVVLIPWPDGTITRCFGVGQLTDLLTEAGLEVAWIRPRTVLSPSVVDHVLRREPGAITRLVRAELQAGDDPSVSSGPEESFGIRLLAAARKAPGGER
jgi:hypothetical protein